MSKVNLKVSAHGATVEIDGRDFARGSLKGLNLSASVNQSPALSLNLYIKDAAQVEIDDASVTVMGIEVSDLVARDLYERLKARFLTTDLAAPRT